MPTLVYDCSRCGAAKSTFDVLAAIDIKRRNFGPTWQSYHETYGVCRHCHVGTTFVLQLTEYDFVNRGWPQDFWQSARALNDFFKVISFIAIKDFNAVKCPDFVPENIKTAFDEGASCLVVAAYNAACAMFRLSIDLATKDLLPSIEDAGGPTARQRNKLFYRIEWLAEKDLIGNDLLELASCVREDGNDGVHDGTLTEDDALDNLEFTEALLRRLFTESARVNIARSRREARRQD